MSRYSGSKTLLAATAEFTVPTGYRITQITSLKLGPALLQCRADEAAAVRDKAADGVYTPASDANAAEVMGTTFGSYDKVKMSTASPCGVEVFWEPA